MHYYLMVSISKIQSLVTQDKKDQGFLKRLCLCVGVLFWGFALYSMERTFNGGGSTIPINSTGTFLHISIPNGFVETDLYKSVPSIEFIKKADNVNSQWLERITTH